MAEARELATAVTDAAAAAGSVKAMEVSPTHQRHAASALDALLDAAASAWAQDFLPSSASPCPIANAAAAASYRAPGGRMTTTGQADSAKGTQVGNHRYSAKAEESPAGAEAGTGQAAIDSAYAEGKTISQRPDQAASTGPTVGPVPAAAAVPQVGAPAAANAPGDAPLHAQAGAFFHTTPPTAAPDAGRIAGTAPQPDAGQPSQVPPAASLPFPTFSGLAFMVQHTASWLPQGFADEPQQREFAASLKRLGRELNKPRKRR